MQLSVSHAFLPKQQSTRASIVMDHFGIGFETGRHVIAEGLELPIRSGDVVCFTGASGSGKSSLMRAVVEQLRGAAAVMNADDLELPETILVEAIDLPVEESLPLLSSCGLGEAHLLLRTPQELSDGQRYRFRLALALSRKPNWIVADEFSATLDRTLAQVVAFNVHRIADRTGTGFLL
ncbi:MAG: ABC transporter, partial [Planctomycetaceae bacterium]